MSKGSTNRWKKELALCLFNNVQMREYKHNSDKLVLKDLSIFQLSKTKDALHQNARLLLIPAWYGVSDALACLNSWNQPY